MSSRRAAAALLLSVAAACVSTPTNDSGEPPAPLIEEVEIVGTATIGKGDVIKGLANHPPLGLIFIDKARLDRLALEGDRRRVESFYREEGYFAVEVSDAEIRDGEKDGVIVRYEVREGPPTIVRSLVLDGSPIDPAPIRALLETHEGAPLRYASYAQDKERIREHLFRAGYAYVKVTGKIRVARATAEAAIRYIVEPGPKVRFGTATVAAGASEVPPSSLLARVAFEPGDPFDPERLEVTERRARELSLLGSVRFDLPQDDPPKEIADVTIHAVDTLPNELRIGFGVGLTATSYVARVTTMYMRRSFFHPLLTFRAELRPQLSLLKNDGSLKPSIEEVTELVRDDLFVSRLTGVLGAGFELSQYELYSTLGPRAYVTLSRPFADDHLQVSTRFELSYLDLSSDISATDSVRFGFYNPQRIASVAPSITWDARDDLVHPVFGAFARVELELGTTVADEGGGYAKLTPEVRAYVPIGTDRLVLAGRVRGGIGFAGAQRIPVDRRYFAGGSESHRGFGRRQLSPDAEMMTGEKLIRGPTGGEAMIESSAELRLDVIQLFGGWLGLVAFADAGDTRERVEEISLGRLHLAVGPGLRYRTPIGPLRFDLGFRLNRTGPGEPEPDGRWAFHFSLGEAF